MLEIKKSCEINNLIQEIVEYSGKTYNEVENACFESYIYPTLSKTFLMETNGIIIDSDRFEEPWLNQALKHIFDESCITEIYITNEI